MCTTIDHIKCPFFYDKVFFSLNLNRILHGNKKNSNNFEFTISSNACYLLVVSELYTTHTQYFYTFIEMI